MEKQTIKLLVSFLSGFSVFCCCIYQLKVTPVFMILIIFSMGDRVQVHFQEKLCLFVTLLNSGPLFFLGRIFLSYDVYEKKNNIVLMELFADYFKTTQSADTSVTVDPCCFYIRTNSMNSVAPVT